MLSTLYFAPYSKSGIFASASREANDGGLAQLARALAWHARGHRFDSDILHRSTARPQACRFSFGTK